MEKSVQIGNDLANKVDSLIYDCIKYVECFGEQDKNHSWYNTYYIQKRSGGYRRIDAPNEPLKELQRRIIKVMFKDGRISNGKHAHGSVIHRSCLTNAVTHKNSRVYIHLDIKECFTSTREHALADLCRVFQARVTNHIDWSNLESMRIFPFFDKVRKKELAYKTADLLASFCFSIDKKGFVFLPQGAPTSPYIVNTFLRKFDSMIYRQLSNYFNEKDIDIRYTRYVDDIAITSNKFIEKPDLTKAIEIVTGLLQSFRYETNKRKTKVYSTKHRMSVTGVIINKNFNASREYRKNLRAAIHQSLLGDPISYQDFQMLQGKVAWVENLYKANKNVYPKYLLQMKQQLTQLQRNIA